MKRVKEPDGRWWLDDGADSGVWPVKLHMCTIFGATVEGDHPNGPYYGETITVHDSRVYDNRGNRPALGAGLRSTEREKP